MQKSKILCLQRNMQNACIEFALLIQRSYCASMHLVLIVDNWPLNHRYYTSLKTASADQKFLITTTENIMRFFNTQYWSELFSDYWKPQMTFCSCCEEFLICTQTYRWRYMTLTLIDSTAFFCYLDMPQYIWRFSANKTNPMVSGFIMRSFGCLIATAAGRVHCGTCDPNSFQVF